jgi:mercuric ion binding protein
MKNLIVIMMASVLSFASNATTLPNEDKVVNIKTSAKCGMCKKKLEREVTLSKGVKEAKLDLKDKVLSVRYADEDKIRKTVSKIGYDADGVVAIQASHDKLPKCCQKSAREHMH